MRTSKLFALIALAVFLLDQITKSLAVFFLSPSASRSFSFFGDYFTLIWQFPYGLPAEAEAPKILGEYLKLTLTTNNGIAWGLLRGYPLQLGLFSIVLCGVILALYIRYGSYNQYLGISFALIFGGAVGNLVDRIRLLEVVDFIDVLIPVINYDFPIFNLADSSAFIGTAMILGYLIWLDVKALRRAQILRLYDHTLYR